MPDQAAFVRRYMPYAKAWEEKTGIPADVFLGWGASESNWGAAGSIFGIKGASPTGKSQRYATWENVGGQRVNTTADFAVYDDPNEAFSHLVSLISSGRYAGAWSRFQRTGDWQKLLADVNAAGYATDPNWHRNVTALAGQIPQVAKAAGVDENATPVATRRQAPAYVFPVEGYSGQIGLHWGEEKGAADLFAPVGTPIRAMRGGTVASVSSDGAGGNNVTIQGDDGNVYYYAHMYQPSPLREGQSVAAGAYVGGVGDTGNAKGTDAHLHIGIGPSINRGVGPQGGAGLGFDAVGLLTQVLSDPSAAVGDEAMPQGRVANSRLSQVADTLLTRYETAQQHVADVQAEIDRLNKTGVPADAQKARQLTNFDLDDARSAASDAQDAWLKAEITAQQYGDKYGAGAAGKEETESQRLGVATNYANTVAQITRAAFGDNIAVQQLMQGMLTSQFDQEYNRWKAGLDRDKLTLDGFVARVSANAAQQTAEAVRAMHAVELAGFINKGTTEMLERLLPPGTHYQPGFAPDDPMYVALRKLGYNPPGITVQEFDPSLIDPRTNLQEADAALSGMGYGYRDLEAGKVGQASNRLAARGDFTPTNTIDMGDFQIPEVPDYEDIFNRFLAGAMQNLAPQETPDTGDAGTAPQQPVRQPLQQIAQPQPKPQPAQLPAANPAHAAGPPGYTGPSSFQSGSGTVPDDWYRDETGTLRRRSFVGRIKQAVRPLTEGAA